MKHTYGELIGQSFDFPQQGFAIKNGRLMFHDVDMVELAEQFGTPLKMTYLPKIKTNIDRARNWFGEAIKTTGYQGHYTYCYCTKSSHFPFIIKETLRNGAQLETSSAFDIQIIRKLYAQGFLNKDLMIVCNGFKRDTYVKWISDLINEGFTNVIPVLDNTLELEGFKPLVKRKTKLGLRIATQEEPQFSFYTSRLGIAYKKIVPYYKEHLKGDDRFEVKMLHYFINTGIRDTAYYWNELRKCLAVYCALKKECPELDTLNIGGGLPIKNTLNFKYDYQGIITEILSLIRKICREKRVPEPHIVTEFGSFTVGESGATLFSILGEKEQNDNECWYMINSSLINTLPDTWALKRRFILLPLNCWDHSYKRVNIGGLTCDSLDFYSWEEHEKYIYLPTLNRQKNLYIGYFHTGAYQESIGGFGGVQHCLIPALKHVLIHKNEDGELVKEVIFKEQNASDMLHTLGY